MQILQSAADAFLLRVVLAPGAPDVAQELSRRLCLAIGNPATVGLECVERLEETPQGKVKTVIQLMQQTGSAGSPAGNLRCFSG